MNRITIITVCYNCANCIEDTIHSVLSLNYPNVEYIIIDGQSKDETMSIIKKYEEHITHVVSEKDKGIYDAMNKGLSLATGDWTFFLNAGDVFDDKDVLLKLPFGEYTQVSDVCAIIGDIKVDLNGDVSVRRKNIPFYRNNKKYKNMGFSHQGVFVKTMYAKSTMFDLLYKLCADYNMMVSLHKQGLKFIETDVPICTIQGGVGASANNRDRQMKEEALVCECADSLTFYVTYYTRKMKRMIKSLVYRNK